MRPPRAPIFLARRAYRQRRLADAARFLPVLGVVLFAMPLIWSPQSTPEPDTVPGARWLFSSWAVLIVLSLIISRRLAREGIDGAGDDGTGDDGAGDI